MLVYLGNSLGTQRHDYAPANSLQRWKLLNGFEMIGLIALGLFKGFSSLCNSSVGLFCYLYNVLLKFIVAMQ